MNIGGQAFRTIWPGDDGDTIQVIDQRLLPHRFEIVTLATLDAVAAAIHDMTVRGAPLIGATAAYGLALALQQDACDSALQQAVNTLQAARPTAVNLRWALQRVSQQVSPLPPAQRAAAAWQAAQQIADEDVAINHAIGQHGLALLRQRWQALQRPLQILTHCNAGWLATVDWGTALAPVYAAFDAGIPLHVWVDETRPRNQGASLTTWELGQHGVAHTLIADNLGGHLMQHGQVDLVIVGSDRTTRCGDVCNKIGTYLKALAAYDNDVPFYVALPSPTIDWQIRDGLSKIPIEQRSADEVLYLQGKNEQGQLQQVRIAPDGTPALNLGFDVTPARLVSGLITERGICPASEAGLLQLFPEHAS
ncbi:MAG: S-methyl-5-thioribose-1-phosphate isomerase [Chitinivorax sp.]